MVLCVLGCGPSRLIDDALDRVVTCPQPGPVVDFGAAPVGDFRQAALEVRGLSAGAHVVLVEVDEPFATPQPQVTLLGPGSAYLPVSFVAPDGRVWLGEAKVKFAGCEDAVISLRGQGLGPPIAVSPAVLELAAPVGTTVTKFVQVTNLVGRSLVVDVDRLMVPTAGAELSHPARVTLAPQEVVEVPVLLDARAVDLVETRLFFRTEEREVQVHVQAQAGLPVVVVDRERVELPYVPRGAVTRQSVRVHNAGVGVMRLSNARIVTPGGVEVATAGAALDGETVNVVVAPPALGTFSWQLELGTNDPARPLVVIPMDVSVVDVAPCPEAVVLAPPRLTVRGPYPTTTELTLTNTSSSECVVSELHLTQFSTTRLSAHQLLVPARGTATVELSLSEPRSDELRYRLHGANTPRAVQLEASP